ncbi:MAG TPA: DUF4149 domain-containing protein [Candidatus Dormibacteraeota bacterium]|nr:DUF4149 domain-containing protein [Candidatus Dormibacteraeota bacterium]
MTVLIWLHIVGAALWLGGLVTLAMVVLVALRTLPREQFRAFVRQAGWAFGALSAVAWLLIAASGLPLAAQLGWPTPIRVKTGLAVAVVLASALHVVTGRQTDSPISLLISRGLALGVFLATLVIVWLGVQAGG